MLQKISKIIFLLFIAIPSFSFAEVGPAQILYNAYKSYCPNTSESNEGTLSNLRIMADVVTQMSEQTECQNLQSLGTVLSRYENDFRYYEAYQSVKGSRFEDEKRVASYVRLLNSGTLSATEKLFIENEIVLAQNDIIGYESNISRFGISDTSEVKAAHDFSENVGLFLQSWANDPKCYDKGNVSQVSSILSNSALSIAPFVNPGSQIWFSAAGLLISSVSDYAIYYKRNKRLRDIDDKQWPIALACMHEALTTPYCDAKDNINLVNEYIDDSGSSNDDYRGVTLISDHLDRLSLWLNEVQAGGSITSEGELLNREAPIMKSWFLDMIKRYVEAFRGIKRKDLRSITTDAEKFKQGLGDAIQNIVYLMSDPIIGNVGGGINLGHEGRHGQLSGVFIGVDSKLLPYQFYGLNVTTVPECYSGDSLSTSQKECRNLADYLKRKGGADVDMTKWDLAIDNALKLIAETKTVVDRERRLSTVLDPIGLIRNSHTDDEERTAPLDGLKETLKYSVDLVGYLEKLNETKRYDLIIKEVKRTNKLIGNMVALIYEAGIPRNFASPPRPPVDTTNTTPVDDVNFTFSDYGLYGEDIDMFEGEFDFSDGVNSLLPKVCWGLHESFAGLVTNEEKLEKKSYIVLGCLNLVIKLDDIGNEFILGKIRKMVEYDIRARYKSGEFSDISQDIIRDTRGDLVNYLRGTFKKNNGSTPTSLDYKNTLTKVQSGIFDTVDIFKDTFKHHIVDALEDMRSVRSTRNGIANPKYLIKQELCFKVLPFMSNDNSELLEAAYKTCNGIVLKGYTDRNCDFFETDEQCVEAPSLYWGSYAKRIKEGVFFPSYKYELSKTKNVNNRFCDYHNYERKNRIFELQYISNRDKRDFKELEKMFDVL